MAKKLTSLGKRILPLMLAVMLIASAMFVPTVVSADTETDPWEQTGLHKTTVIDFNGSTNIADYAAAGTTPVLNAYSSIKDGALYMKNILTSSDFKVRFDAYGDIETLSMDIKTDEYSAAGGIPGIIFYDEIYTDKDGNSVASVSTLGFSVRADGRWRARSYGLCGDGVVRDASEEKVWDWSSAYYTLTLTYGTEYINNSDNGTNIRKDKLGNELICKFLTNVTVTDVNGTKVYDWVITTAQADYTSSHTTYGVNKILTDAEDNENVMIGFGPQYENAYLGMYVDNIKVTYRENANKVMALIDEIGTVEVTEDCLANIVKAETAYGLLTEAERAKVTNYETLTAARATYNNLVENADVYAVVNLIAKIGAVDASDACLAKIVAAEEAYMALAPEKLEKVSNYAVLKKARADYNAAKYGIHSDTVIDFNGSTNIADYTAAGTTPTISKDTAIVDGALKISGNNNIRFDAYGDIKTLSMDIKMNSETIGAVTPGIVFYDEIYTYGDDQVATSTAILELGCNANGWRVKTKGNGSIWRDITSGNNIGVNWAENWLTVTFTYGEKFVLMKDSGYDRKDPQGNTLYCKYVNKVAITKLDGTPVYSWTIDEGTHFINCQSSTYGVNWTLTGENVADNENVTFGFTNSSTTQLGMSVDNIKVAYRENVAKVEAFIAAIGTVEATDACLAKIVDAETAYGLLSDAEKAEVSNYETLTTARATYNNLVENADVYAVETLITAIGVVENSETCLEKIVAAEEAYAALTPEKQALVSNAATLTSARAAYDELVAMAPVKAVEDLIAAIGTVDASEDCLAKIVAAEEAYAALDAGKQALVSNYEVLTKARADYNAAKYGIHNDTVIDFNGSTNIADYTAAGTTPTIAKDTAITDGALHLTGNNNIRFDAYGDVETFSMDIKMNSETVGRITPGIVFYDEIYTYLDENGEEQTVAATSTLEFGYNANGWRVRIKGLTNTWRDVTGGNNIGVDWSQNWLTAKFTYGKTNVLMKDDGYDRTDIYGKTLYCKYLTKVELLNGNGSVYTWSIGTGNHFFTCFPATYGVNWTVTGENVADNENVTVGFTNCSAPASQVDMSVDNIKVTYRNDKATGLVASAKDIAVVDNSAALAQKVALMEETYNILPANQQDGEAKAAIDALKAKIAIAAAAEAPTVDGATIRTTTATSDQNLRFKTTMPTTAIDGYDIVEFGTVMFPAQYLGENELTFDSSYKLSNGNIATVLAAKANAADYEELPTAFEAELYGIDFNESKNACGIRISARSYVKYSDGETTFIIYSKNDKQPNTEATEGVKNGTCTRSVFSVSRTIATALLDTATYPTETFGEIVGSIDLATNTNSEILGFVYNNLARVREIAKVR